MGVKAITHGVTLTHTSKNNNAEENKQLHMSSIKMLALALAKPYLEQPFSLPPGFPTILIDVAPVMNQQQQQQNQITSSRGMRLKKKN